MKTIRLTPLTLFLLALLLALPSAPVSAAELLSPDGRVKLTVAVKERLEPFPAGRRLYYSVAFEGRTVVADSTLGLDFADQAPLARDLVIEGEARRSWDETWQTVVGKSKDVRDHGNELTLSLREAGEPNRKLQVVFRAYDDGVAFRYVLPKQPELTEFRLADERSEFRFVGDPEAWAADYEFFASHQESEYKKTRLSAIAPAAHVGPPLLVKAGEKVWVAVTEANLRDWAGMYLGGTGAPGTLVSRLAPRHDDAAVTVVGKTPHVSTWRVLMIADDPGRLIESNIVLNLSEPLAIEDPSWITPGRSAWDRWWSGDWAPAADFKIGMNTATMKYFTDLAAEMGWEYVLVDWGWYGPITNFEHGGDQDCTTSIPEVDVPEIVRYANGKGVKVLLWVFWTHMDRKMDEALALYETWGVSGIKVDFMARDDQWMVNWYEELVRKAAAHELTVDLHGAYKPTGLRRAYPNLLTREGVLGNEYNKWSKRVTPEHKVTIPFTRMLAGPMDFTPGGFLHATPATFEARNRRPQVMGTRAAELAQLVVYESPLQVICDSPDIYRWSPMGVEFLKEVATTWDEVRVLNGVVGEYVTIARRSGERWFLGSMTGTEGRTLEVPLAFLGDGEWKARIWADAYEAATEPGKAVERTQKVTPADSLTMALAPAGGQAVILERAGE